MTGYNDLQQILAYYGISAGSLLVSIIVILVIAVLLCSLFAFLSAKIVKASHPTFGAAVLATIVYVLFSFVKNFIVGFTLPMEFYYSNTFALIDFAISIGVLSWCYSGFFKTSYLKGLGISGLVIIMLAALLLILSFVFSFQ
ncbi:hypothetical protein [Zophobihabitans entericus]|uniref:Uncharacterized protein n=1 Tax=Zophobihabitans entericus TaxID=1635327 RepID=A0A6G9IBR8_9GAMM|nr:hypothetical protein [Zophobihabitans entericus]QIQ21277.1 hypothetical protein IPMB12_06005 [Zophobihabitans entericus]